MEAKLPSSDELKVLISKLLDIRRDQWGNVIAGDELMVGALSRHAKINDSAPAFDAAQFISEKIYLAPSIDEFLDRRRESEDIRLCGKLAIVRAILRAEGDHQCLLLPHGTSKQNQRIEFSRLRKTWYLPFWYLLTHGISKEDDIKTRLQSVALVIFNYDRCVEHFLIGALKDLYEKPESEAAKLVQDMEIYHPYGTVGDLPAISPKGAVGFGETPNEDKLLKLTEKISTFTEERQNGSDLQRAHTAIAYAKRLVFLGFGFNEQNIQLLTPHRDYLPNRAQAVQAFATTYGASKSKVQYVKDVITRLYGETKRGGITVNVQPFNKPCAEFFQDNIEYLQI